MAKTREIRGRIKAVSNIQRITKTMQMIATARFQAAQRRVTASKPFSRKIAEMVGELATALSGDQDEGSSISHPLLKSPSPAVGKKLVLLVTSTRGLCGGYNANLLRSMQALLRESTDTKIDLEVVGKKGLNALKFAGTPVSQFLADFGEKTNYEQVEALAERYMAAFIAGGYDRVQVVYMGFHSMSKQSPVVLNLLPLQPPTAAKDQAKTKALPLYDFLPEPAELLAELLPMTVKTTLYQCFNEALVSEQLARMVAMKSATDAAGKMKKSLTRKYNRARQAAITTELMEVISGAAGLEG